MPRNYYYLVAGLPDLILDNTKKSDLLSAVMDEIVEQVHPQDAALFDMFRFRHDNTNLIAILEKQEKEFDARGVFSREELEQEIKQPALIPAYMQTFLDSYNEGKPLFAALTWEDQLLWLYYDFATGHTNEFIRQWSGFDRDCRNVLAGLNCRKIQEAGDEGRADFSPEKSILGTDDVADMVRRSTAPDFSLAARLSWVEKLLSFNKDNLVEYEKSVDMLRWEILDELTTFTYFQIETLLAFYIKLSLVQRWQELDPDTGKETLARLLAELESGYTLQEDVK